MPNKKETRAKTFICNSLLLTLSAVLMRAVGVGYNIYISNRVGAPKAVPVGERIVLKKHSWNMLRFG